MWIIEVNFAGHQFTQRVPDRPADLPLQPARRALASVAAPPPPRRLT